MYFDFHTSNYQQARQLRKHLKEKEIKAKVKKYGNDRYHVILVDADDPQITRQYVRDICGENNLLSVFWYGDS